MEFKLVYKGKLKSNGNASEKHRIRLLFHEQLKSLWAYPPLDSYPRWIQVLTPEDATIGFFSSVKTVGGQNFAMLVCRQMHMFCELDFLILKPEMTGGFGDLDNKLKTIFDALRFPNNAQEVPPTWTPSPDENPLVCLLEDDVLITRFSVNVDRLLEPEVPNDEVLMIITVNVKGSTGTAAGYGIV